MSLLELFFDPTTVALKICGVTSHYDANQLVEMGVDALGVNFWPQSKRYLAPDKARWLSEIAGKILRVGVFVNQNPEIPLQLVRDGYLDVVQLHGDESPEDVTVFSAAKVPFIKAIGVKTIADLQRAADFGATAILLDAHAPGIYGGTGERIDEHAELSIGKWHLIFAE